MRKSMRTILAGIMIIGLLSSPNIASASGTLYTESFQTLPSFSSTYDSPAENAATWKVAAGGYGGRFSNQLQVSVSQPVESARTKSYPVPAYKLLEVKVYIKCPSSATDYHVTAAARVGDRAYTAEEFINDKSGWAIIKEFSTSGENGNGDQWTAYSCTIQTGATTVLTWVFDVGSTSGAFTIGFDELTVVDHGSYPVIQTQPQDVTATIGGTATFTVAATGDAPLSYQWKKDGNNLTDGGNISGATTATLTISNAQVSDDGSYTVEVTNAAGSVTSNAATLTVNTAPVLDADGYNPTLTAINEDDYTSNGNTVTEIVPTGSITYADGSTAKNIAITSVDNANGKWQYSINGGATWLDVSSVTGSNVDLSANSLLLDENACLRFVPNADWNGTSTFTYRAWQNNGAGLQLDGVNDYVAVSGLSTYASITFESWVRLDSFSDGFNVIMNGNNWEIPGLLHTQFLKGNPTQLEIAVSYSPTPYVRFDYDFNQIVGKWTHIAVTINKATGNFKLYVDGVYKETKNRNLSGIPGINVSNFSIGAWNNSGTMQRFSKGIFSDFRLWSVERSAQEIADNMANGSLIGSETGLVGYWKFNEGTGAVAADSGPGHHNGIIYGGAAWVSSSGQTANTTINGGSTLFSETVETASINVNPVPEAPSIITQPISQTVTAGQTATFTVAATGDEPLTYQWKKEGDNLTDGGNISGASTATLTIISTQASDAGSYTCNVSNAAGSITSNAATLTVNPAAVEPAIDAQPVSATKNIGETATFTVSATASDGGTLSYQWQKSADNGATWNNIDGATSASYTTGTLAYAENGSQYRCVVTNSKNGTTATATSAATTLTVNPAAVEPSITTQPASQTVTAGQTATFTVVATGDAPLSYQWQKDGGDISDGGNISGSTTPTLVITNAQASDAGAYTVEVTNVAGSVTSEPATLTVNPAPVAPSITTQPSNQTVTAGQTATFTVAATGTTPLSYQWKKDGNNLSDGGSISGATTATLTITNAQASDAGSYTCYVGNAAGNTTSNVATLTVNPAPILSATISPTTATFDKNPANQADVSTTITWNDAASVADVKNAGVSVGVAVYDVSGNTLTIKKEFLATQPTGSLVLTVEFDKGDAATLTITVQDTTQPNGSTPPTWPAGSTLTASGTTKTGTTLTWTPAVDDMGVTGYRLFQDNLLIKTFTGTVYSCDVTGLSPSTTYTFKVQAGDADGNWTDGPTVTVRTDSYGSGGDNSGGSESGTSAAPTYKALVSGTEIKESTLPVNVNTDTGSATTDMGTLVKDIFAGTGTTVLNVPSIPGVNSYTLGMPAASLSDSQGEGALTFSTGAGSITIPAGMLAGIAGTEGSSAGITIAKGDKSGLPAEVQAAIGDRPIIQLTLTLDGVQTEWNNPDAPVTVSIP
ncbi:MAG: immunoglobulin domain-containing protein [Bacillota bacterium]